MPYFAGVTAIILYFLLSGIFLLKTKTGLSP